ncbi:PrsW family intramembrane metalloprotease [Streptomyces sp. NBC_00083]|uniref:PrsW family intramembrane metalloprotease n=1 Tax=Streptomyces sp. NBC_00083 TaxID=2975647 RepID=UPI0022598155|nr:PrsW family intramembrane metalloprotease [Streptomyces sp. NBC_00083]MCX5387751.1 PrsW family intramembrane metalloprotease [Streptomyces sp. NBC_00083]
MSFESLPHRPHPGQAPQQPGQAVPARPVPACADDPRFDAVPPDRAKWRYRPRRDFWRSKAVRAGALITLLALCGLVIFALVREQTGTEGFLVGLGLAVLPVPLLGAAFRWLDRVDPGPWRNLFFALAWGACAAALVAIIANSFATRWIATATADPSSADHLGASVIAPIVEESAKAAAVLLLFCFRRRDFHGIVDGVVFAGFTATGFAFTENILYLGNAFGEDQASHSEGLTSTTAATFFVRVVMSPFAHPLFTVLSGIGFGFAALSPPGRRLRRVAFPLLGLVLAMGMHALWNSSALFGTYGFYIVYGAVMVPVFGLLTWLAVWSRQRELRTVAAELPAYAAAGWLGPAEPLALSSMRARATARDFAHHRFGGKAAARAVAEYEAFATTLAFLRHRAYRSAGATGPGPDFAAREQELLHHLWERKPVAAPALLYAAGATGRIWLPPQPGPPHPYTQHAQYAPQPRYAPYGQPGPAAGPAPYGAHNPYLR